MMVLEKKKTLTKTITFMAIVAAINVILSFMTNFVPFLTVVLIIVLPLTSSIVEVACEDKFFPIYAFGTLGLSFAVTFWNLDFAIFYLLPSIITGFLFGLMTKKAQKPVWTIFISVIVQTILLFAFVPLMELITDRNLINDLVVIFGYAGFNEFGDYIFLAFFVVSIIQIALSYIAVSAELTKLGFTIKKPYEIDNKIPLFSLGSICLSIPFLFIYKALSYLFAGISLFFCFFILLKFVFEKRFKKIIVSGLGIFGNLFVFAIFNPLMSYGQFLLIQFAPLIISCCALINSKN